MAESSIIKASMISSNHSSRYVEISTAASRHCPFLRGKAKLKGELGRSSKHDTNEEDDGTGMVDDGSVILDSVPVSVFSSFLLRSCATPYAAPQVV